MVEGARQVAHQSLQCYHNLCSMLGAVEKDFVPSVGVHSEHRVTIDHKHRPKLGCSGLEHHHCFPSFDSCFIVYSLIRDRRETRVLFLSVYLAYKEVGSARIKNNKTK